MPYRLKEILERVPSRLTSTSQGMPKVDHASSFLDGDVFSLVFNTDPSASVSGASIIISVPLDNHPVISTSSQAWIFTLNPKLAFAKICNELFPPPSLDTDGFGFVRDHDGSLVRFPHYGYIHYGKNVEVGKYTAIDRGSLGNTVIGDGVKIDNLVHVAHNVRIGDHSLIVAGAVLGGSCVIGKRCFIGMNATIRNGVTIGDDVTIGMGAVVTKDVPSGETWAGNPARKFK